MKKSILIAALLAMGAVSCKKTHSDPVPVPEIKTVNIGGRDYPVVKIGNQNWTAANYEGAGGVAFSAPNSKPAYGKYYTKAEMKSILVPSGWHVPTMAEYRTMAESVGIIFTANANNTDAIRKLTSAADWLHVQGTNALGFNAFPAGYIVAGIPPASGDNAEFWTWEGNTFSMMEGGNQTTLVAQFFAYSSIDTDRFTVRFVKN